MTIPCQALVAERLASRPILINVSGIDGSGKTTQIELLRDWLASSNVMAKSLKNSAGLRASSAFFRLTEEATGDPYAYPPIIPPTLQFFTIACDTVAPHHAVVVPLLNEGATVLLDRNKLCYRAYARAYGADPTWIDRIFDLVATKGLTLLYDVRASMSEQRLRQRTEKPIHGDEAPSFLREVRKHYLDLAAEDSDVVVIDGEGDIEEVQARSREALCRFMR